MPHTKLCKMLILQLIRYPSKILHNNKSQQILAKPALKSKKHKMTSKNRLKNYRKISV